MHDPYKFHIPNQEHESSIQEGKYEIPPQMKNNSNNSIVNTMTMITMKLMNML